MTIESSISTEQVVAFLQENPDFFKDNATVIADLNFDHDTQGGAISLIQRQVELLRTHLSQNRERLAELARNANHNESLLRRFQELAVAVAESKDHNHTATILHRKICLDFGLSLLEVVVPEGIWNAPNERVIELSQEDFTDFSSAIYDLPLYLGKAPAKLRETVLSEKAELASSIALIRLNIANKSGYILIGSKDEKHFQNDMGTEFVSFLGEYISAVLSKFL